MNKKISVGDVLYLAYDDRRQKGRDVVVSKVGRQWIYFDGNRPRFDPVSFYVDGGNYSSPGRIYYCQQDYQDAVDLRSAWSRLKRLVDDRYTAPDGVTEEMIEQAGKLLKVWSND